MFNEILDTKSNFYSDSIANIQYVLNIVTIYILVVKINLDTYSLYITYFIVTYYLPADRTSAFSKLVENMDVQMCDHFGRY